MPLPLSPILTRPEPPKAVVLYILEQAGCDHCLRAEQYLQKLEAEFHRRGGVPPFMVIRLDASRRDQIAGWTPKSTPAYALTVNRELVKHHEGVLTDVQLRRWITAVVE